MMSGTSWSQEQILLFLETLQSEPVIWDPNDRFIWVPHKDKKKFNDAWVRIQKIVEMPIEDLKKKEDSLIATYRGYRRKKEDSIKSGAGVDDVYRPVWFAYQYMDSFLDSVYKCKQIITTDQNIVTGPIERKEENDTSWSAELTTSPAPADTQNSTETSDPKTTQNRTIRRRLNPPDLQIASKQMSEAFNNLNKVINRTAKDDEDECDVFGKLIAKKLKKMPEHEREDLMFDIHALFRRIHSVEKSSCIESFRSSTPNTSEFPTYSKYKPFIQIPSTSSFKLKQPKSANSTIYSNARMASPRPHSSFSEPPNTFSQFSEQSNERQYILHIPESNENVTLNPNSAMIYILSDEVVRPADNMSSVIISNVTQTQSVPDHDIDMSDLIRQAYYKS